MLSLYMSLLKHRFGASPHGWDIYGTTSEGFKYGVQRTAIFLAVKNTNQATPETITSQRGWALFSCSMSPFLLIAGNGHLHSMILVILH